MESIGSNQIPSYTINHVPQPVTDRILRALRHRIRLLHRPNAATFHVMGATCNVYTVTLAATPMCSCPDRKKPCKHILFVLIRVLGIPFDDKCLRHRRLRPCLLYRLLSAPTRPDCLASFSLQQRFLHLFSAAAAAASLPGHVASSSSSTANVEENVREDEEEEEPATCPICLDEIINAVKYFNGDCNNEKDREVVKCRVCKNKVHEECMLTWRKSRGRRPASCVVCRARWRGNNTTKPPNVDSNYENCHQTCYLNLAPYVNEEEENGVGTSQRSC